MEKKVLTQEELQEVKDLQIESSNLISQFGELEVVIQNLSLKKEELITKLKELKDKEVKIGQILQEKYGDGNIDIETGEFKDEKNLHIHTRSAARGDIRRVRSCSRRHIWSRCRSRRTRGSGCQPASTYPCQ